LTLSASPGGVCVTAMVFSSLAGIWVMLRLPYGSAVRDLSCLLQRVRRVVLSRRISDHWKALAMRGYSSGLLRVSFKVAALCLAPLAPLALVWVVCGVARS
jgi:hypothetical protein